MSDMSELRNLLLKAAENLIEVKPDSVSPKWLGGKLVLQPGGDAQSKEMPIDVFVKKVISLRDNLRVLEQKINTHETLSAAEKLNFHGYITKCYGSLTSFNVLFRNEADRFIGSGQDTKKDATEVLRREGLTLAQAKKRIGLAEHGED